MKWACNAVQLISSGKLQGELGGGVLAPAAWAPAFRAGWLQHQLPREAAWGVVQQSQ